MKRQLGWISIERVKSMIKIQSNPLLISISLSFLRRKLRKSMRKEKNQLKIKEKRHLSRGIKFKVMQRKNRDQQESSMLPWINLNNLNRLISGSAKR
jgi:hypothetical protein